MGSFFAWEWVTKNIKLRQLKYLLLAPYGTAAERLRNAIKLRLKSPLKDWQECKKVHVTGFNEAIFLWPENRGSFFMNSRTNYELPLLEGSWCLDKRPRFEIKCNGPYWSRHWWNLLTFKNAASYWVKLQKIRAEEGAIILSLISLFFLLVLVFVQEGRIRNGQVLSVSCTS